MTISVNIDLTKIDKGRIKTFQRKDGSEGKGYDMIIFLKDEADQFKNHGTIVTSVPKDNCIG